MAKTQNKWNSVLLFSGDAIPVVCPWKIKGDLAKQYKKAAAFAATHSAPETSGGGLAVYLKDGPQPPLEFLGAMRRARYNTLPVPNDIGQEGIDTVVAYFGHEFERVAANAARGREKQKARPVVQATPLDVIPSDNQHGAKMSEADWKRVLQEINSGQPTPDGY